MGSDVRMHFDVSGALLDSARECEAEVFLRWFGNTREQLAEEYGPYEDSSVFLVLADERDEVLGAVRLLAPGGRAGLKTLADVGRGPWGVDGGRVAAAAGRARRPSPPSAASPGVSMAGGWPRRRGSTSAPPGRSPPSGCAAAGP